MILRDPHQAAKDLPSNVKRFLNSSPWDILLSEELAEGRVSSKNLSRHAVIPSRTNAGYL